MLCQAERIRGEARPGFPAKKRAAPCRDSPLICYELISCFYWQ